MFERMWPTLQQPWYFNFPCGITIDTNKNIYVADTFNHRIHKYNSNGQFITSWGVKGGNPGQMEYPFDIAADTDGYVYIIDSHNRVQKFSTDGRFIMSWGSSGSGDGQLNAPWGICVDSSGNVYVADTDNHRIQKFTLEGQFITKWGSVGSAAGQFSFPRGIGTDGSGNVYVADTDNERIQIFTSSGDFLAKWDSVGSGPGQFNSPYDVKVDAEGNVYVAEEDNNHRIQKLTSAGTYITHWTVPNLPTGVFFIPFGLAIEEPGHIYVADMDGYIWKFTSDGQLLTQWSPSGYQPGQFLRQSGMAHDSAGNLYVADSWNHRIQKFSADGSYITQWGGFGGNDGQLNYPLDIAVNASDQIYVVDMDNARIQKFDTTGGFIGKWGTYGTGTSQFRRPNSIAIDGSGNVYVQDSMNHRIQKFTADGTFLSQWGGYGIGDGQFNFADQADPFPGGISLDASGNLHVADFNNHRIQKFNSAGEFLSKWGIQGTADGQIQYPYGIFKDEPGNMHVTDQTSGRIQMFTPEGVFISKWGNFGSQPGQISEPVSLAFSAGGDVYISDTGNNRIQLFKKVATGASVKAIVVAGGGPFPGNNLWNATQMTANFAYRTLTYQGFTKESIYYLTSDTDLDLDGNGVLDDVDGDATNANLQNAITNWAADAENLVIYLVDHGGNGTFRMSGTETLSAVDLDTWLDQLQQTLPGKVTVIYDACESGSFISQLTPPAGKERIVIGSTSPGESAYFVTQGSVSFSNYFWTHIFNGLNVKQAFDLAKESLSYTTNFQHPLLDDNGNGTANESEDGPLAQNTFIGNGTVIYGDAPVIESVSPDQIIHDTNSALLFAENVTDSDGIARVWATVRPPSYTQANSYNTVNELPSFDLLPVGNDRWETTWEGFSIPGTYHLAIYARDRIGNTAVPKITTVSVNNPLRHKAVIVAAGWETDQLWPAVERNALLAYNTLKLQGLPDEDIYVMAPQGIAGLTVDGDPTASNFNTVLSTWAAANAQDLTLYVIANGNDKSFRINQTENISAEEMDALLDTLQGSLPGKVTVIYDACRSGSFLSSLIPPAGKERILISSSSTDQSSHFVSDGRISFSGFFWAQILNGADLYRAFVHAKNAMWYVSHGSQTAYIDDNGNGIGNEKIDGIVARDYSIGVGIMLAGDDPLIGSVSSEETLNGGTSATIWAQDVTTTGTIDKVWAVITPPQSDLSLPNEPVTNLPTVDLVFNAGINRWEGTYNNFTTFGTYGITVYAMDALGNLSLPASTSVIQTVGSDVYEDDDTLGSARVITINGVDAQRHTFHDMGDQDWVMFYGVAGETYEIKTENLGTACDTTIELFDQGGTPLLNEPWDDYPYEGTELLSWQCPADGIYYVKISQYDPADFGANTEYDLRVYHPVGGTPGMLIGKAVDSFGNGIGGAIIKAESINTTAISLPGGAYLMVLPVGTYSITAQLPGYSPVSQGNIVITSENHASFDFTVVDVQKGDINGSGTITLSDAILSLQAAVGIEPSSPVFNQADVSGDGKVGLEELIYILQSVSGLRK